jgi:pyridoxal phosphate enzyme (YggS family)
MTTVESRIAENLSRIGARIDSACRRASRPSASVRLVAVTKSAALEWIDAIIALGVRDLGESRPQLLLERAEQIQRSEANRRPEAVQTPVRWHLIGHLQRNKVRKTLPVADWLHSIDSLLLAARIDSLSAELGLRPRLLLEVNVSGEASKDGYSPEQLAADWTAICALSHVEIAGLMTMAPFSDEPEDSRATFRQLRELRDRLADLPRSPRLGELSMGMSGDFEVGIEEGATLIRIGTSLFDGLPAQA